MKNKEESDEEGTSSESEKEAESLEQAEHLRTGYVLYPLLEKKFGKSSNF